MDSSGAIEDSGKAEISTYNHGFSFDGTEFDDLGNEASTSRCSLANQESQSVERMWQSMKNRFPLKFLDSSEIIQPPSDGHVVPNQGIQSQDMFCETDNVSSCIDEISMYDKRPTKTNACLSKPNAQAQFAHPSTKQIFFLENSRISSSSDDEEVDPFLSCSQVRRDENLRLGKSTGPCVHIEPQHPSDLKKTPEGEVVSSAKDDPRLSIPQVEGQVADGKLPKKENAEGSGQGMKDVGQEKKTDSEIDSTSGDEPPVFRIRFHPYRQKSAISDSNDELTFPEETIFESSSHDYRDFQEQMLQDFPSFYDASHDSSFRLSLTSLLPSECTHFNSPVRTQDVPLTDISVLETEFQNSFNIADQKRALELENSDCQNLVHAENSTSKKNSQLGTDDIEKINLEYDRVFAENEIKSDDESIELLDNDFEDFVPLTFNTTFDLKRKLRERNILLASQSTDAKYKEPSFVPTDADGDLATDLASFGAEEEIPKSEIVCETSGEFPKNSGRVRKRNAPGTNGDHFVGREDICQDETENFNDETSLKKRRISNGDDDEMLERHSCSSDSQVNESSLNQTKNENHFGIFSINLPHFLNRPPRIGLSRLESVKPLHNFRKRPRI